MNINYIRNKFENLFELVAGNADILFIAEAKLDPLSPNSQFLMTGFHKPPSIVGGSQRGGVLGPFFKQLPVFP